MSLNPDEIHDAASNPWTIKSLWVIAVAMATCFGFGWCACTSIKNGVIEQKDATIENLKEKVEEYQNVSNGMSPPEVKSAFEKLNDRIEKLEQQKGYFTEKEKEDLRNFLRELKQTKVRIEPAETKESKAYSKDLEEVLTSAGLKVEFTAGSSDSSSSSFQPPQIIITGDDREKTTEILINAFKSIKTSAKPSKNANSKDNETRISIGKPGGIACSPAKSPASSPAKSPVGSCD